MKIFTHILKWLSRIDLGSQSVPIKWSTRSISDPSKKTYNVSHGSAIGGILTIFYMLLIIGLFTYRLEHAIAGEFDSTKSYSRTVDLDYSHDANMVNSTLEELKFKFTFAIQPKQ